MTCNPYIEIDFLPILYGSHLYRMGAIMESSFIWWLPNLKIVQISPNRTFVDLIFAYKHFMMILRRSKAFTADHLTSLKLNLWKRDGSHHGAIIYMMAPNLKIVQISPNRTSFVDLIFAYKPFMMILRRSKAFTADHLTSLKRKLVKEGISRPTRGPPVAHHQKIENKSYLKIDRVLLITIISY